VKTSTALLTLAAVALAAAIMAPVVQHATEKTIDGVAAARAAREAELAKQEAVRTWQQQQQAQLDVGVAKATADTATELAPAWQAAGLILALALGGALVMLVYGLSTAAITAARLRATLIHADPDQVSAAYPLVTTPSGIIALPPPALARREAVATLTAPAPITTTPLLPIAGTWSEVRQTFTPTADRLMLGVSVDGPIYAPLTGLLSVLIVGRPGSGKTTLLRLLAEQAIMAGARCVCWDLHNDMRLDGVELCTDEATIGASATAIMAEIDARRRTGRGAPVVVMVDELPLLARAVPEAGTAMRRIVLEGRKFGVYGLIAGQGAPADLFDGGRLVRDATASRFVFRSSTAEARRAGLERVESLTTSTLPTGVCVLDGSVVERPTVVSIPRLDAPRLLPGSTTSGYTTSGTLPGSGSYTGSTTGSSPMAEAVMLVRSGQSMTAALRTVYGVDGGRRFSELRTELAAALGGQS
jgi:energy-coupling factor transporter ATP-binding protein EcfA2